MIIKPLFLEIIGEGYLPSVVLDLVRLVGYLDLGRLAEGEVVIDAHLQVVD